jgi:O-antigen/teichoic acid export membrane protein
MTIGSKLFSDSDVLMIRWFIGEDSDKAVGLYNSAVLLPCTLDSVLMAIAAVMTPRLSIAVRNRKENEIQVTCCA